MKYNKPEIVVVANAISAVKGQNKHSNVKLDSDQSTRDVTIAAYESDE